MELATLDGVLRAMYSKNSLVPRSEVARISLVPRSIRALLSLVPRSYLLKKLRSSFLVARFFLEAVSFVVGFCSVPPLRSVVPPSASRCAPYRPPSLHTASLRRRRWLYCPLLLLPSSSAFCVASLRSFLASFPPPRPLPSIATSLIAGAFSSSASVRSSFLVAPDFWFA